MRQPQLANTSLAMVLRQIQMMISARRRPTVAVVWIQLVDRPRLSVGACSAT